MPSGSGAPTRATPRSASTAEASHAAGSGRLRPGILTPVTSPAPAPCEDLQGVPLDSMPPGGCVECLRIGDTWVHLRFCVTCRETRCCDDSKNRHARKHAEATDHPVVRSKEPGEHWAWCYRHEAGVALSAG
jgi:hypothetical protein